MAEAAIHTLKRDDASSQPSRSFIAGVWARHARKILLGVLPAMAIIVGVGLYLAGGRYISTDNAYVGAEKVLITPDISGKVSRVLVREGQHVEAGASLFEIDPQPFELAVRQAQSKLDTVVTDLANLKSNYKSLNQLVELGQQAVDIKQRDVERKTALAARQTSTQVDVDNANAALLTAELQLQLGRQQLSSTFNQLLGKADLSADEYPPYQQAKAALDQAKRDLDHTLIKAPIAGTATQVDNIQLGRFVTAGTPVFSVIDDSEPWVDANLKETDITHLALNQPVEIDVDSFPDHPLHGHVASVSPGTGAQFAILPPQNASGNWVKVVQRVPVRIVFDRGEDVSRLRAGMSVTVSIDTGRQRTVASLFGASPSIAKEVTREVAKDVRP
jgi:membrane fusion protein, multidrug efflux system